MAVSLFFVLNAVAFLLVLAAGERTQDIAGEKPEGADINPIIQEEELVHPESSLDGIDPQSPGDETESINSDPRLETENTDSDSRAEGTETKIPADDTEQSQFPAENNEKTDTQPLVENGDSKVPEVVDSQVDGDRHCIRSEEDVEGNTACLEYEPASKYKVTLMKCLTFLIATGKIFRSIPKGCT